MVAISLDKYIDEKPSKPSQTNLVACKHLQASWAWVFKEASSGEFRVVGLETTMVSKEEDRFRHEID